MADSNNRNLRYPEAISVDHLCWCIQQAKAGNIDPGFSYIDGQLVNGDYQINALEEYLKNVLNKSMMEYRQKGPKGRGYGRYWPQQLCLTNMARAVRHTIATKYIDIDIVNAHPVLLRHWCVTNGIDTSGLDTYLNNRDEAIANEIQSMNAQGYEGANRDVVKRVYLAIMNGKTIEECEATLTRDAKCSIKLTDAVRHWASTIGTIHEAVCNVHTDIYQRVYKDKRRYVSKSDGLDKWHEPYNVKGATMNHVLCTMENQCLMEMIDTYTEYCRRGELPSFNAQLVSPAYDGMMVAHKGEYTRAELDKVMRGMERSIKDRYGYEVSIKDKAFDLAWTPSDEELKVARKEVLANVSSEALAFQGLVKSPLDDADIVEYFDRLGSICWLRDSEVYAVFNKKHGWREDNDDIIIKLVYQLSKHPKLTGHSKLGKLRTATAGARIARLVKGVLGRESDDNATPHLLGFTNGIYNLKTRTLEPFSKDIVITQRMGIPYEETPIDSAEIHFSGVWSADVTEYMWKVLATCLVGKSPDLLPILTGVGSNGKSYTLLVLKQMFGEYYQQVSNSVLCDDGSGRGASPEHVSIHNKRVCVYEEVGNGKNHLSESGLKKLAGNHTINARGLYSSKTVVRNIATHILTANRLPQIDGLSNAGMRRITVIDHESIFMRPGPAFDKVKLVHGDRVQPIREGIELPQYLKGLAASLFCKLVGYVDLEVLAPEKPKSVLKACEGLIEESNPFMAWWDENIYYGDNIAISLKELWNRFTLQERDFKITQRDLKALVKSTPELAKHFRAKMPKKTEYHDDHEENMGNKCSVMVGVTLNELFGKRLDEMSDEETGIEEPQPTVPNQFVMVPVDVEDKPTSVQAPKVVQPPKLVEPTPARSKVHVDEVPVTEPMWDETPQMTDAQKPTMNSMEEKIPWNQRRSKAVQPPPDPRKNMNDQELLAWARAKMADDAQ